MAQMMFLLDSKHSGSHMAKREKFEVLCLRRFETRTERAGFFVHQPEILEDPPKMFHRNSMHRVELS